MGSTRSRAGAGRRAPAPAAPRATSHVPLSAPTGMRDQLPPDARDRAALASRVLTVFESYGYERVTTPAFEHAEVIERGLEVDRRDVLRFVEPETGEVALLRPDITPQIARIVATSLKGRPAPWRLCYHGTVLRRARGRARRSRQLSQAGVEHVGTAHLDADVEVVALAARALLGAGLRGFRLELGQVRIGRAVLASLPDAARLAAADALGQKDVVALEAVLKAAHVPAVERRRLADLTGLYGDGAEPLKRARRRFRDVETRAALDELEALHDRIVALGLGEHLGVDLGELRGHAYYTGTSFTILAEGPGEPIGGGGRYDQLLARFGRAAPATGFAIDVEHLAWALAAEGAPWAPPTPPRIVAVDAPSALVDALREQGAQVATLPEGWGRGGSPSAAALAYARAWRYDAVLLGADRLVRVGDERAIGLERMEGVDLAGWLLEG
ncbi:MAG: ATP phosphoribosyltransferase regulatory subunit [Myxococcales bacterium]|nr:ATP phosphoribosyltransferase regulatory subunit [Myxococcales bacterium]